MRRVGLCVLGLLCLHSWVLGQEAAEVQPGVLVFCDDSAVEKAVSNALDKFNEKVVVGNKMALYQILSASKSENGSDSVYSVQFSSRKSDCPAGGDKPWTECDYLPDGPKEPCPCNATVSMTEAETETTDVHCQLADPVVPERAPCLGCPEVIDETSEDLRVPLTMSIAKFNSISNSSHLFTLNEVGHATRQVVAGFRYKLSFDMRKSTCSKAEHKDLHDLCVPNDEDVELANCNSTVDVAPWRYENQEANVECGPGPLPPMLFTRRRPPGWSPLRNVINFQQVDASSSSPTTSPPATTAATKEESSEEEDPAATNPAPTKAADPVADSPFHCPSKPWKEFSPVQPTATADPAATESASSLPPADGAFSDLDLVG
ncbi:kininogen-1 [Centroberyx gerrardi]|uniref:kininogen-1 n=1 Tax=Centroberyx gerrardi TaxID=166262 RepID=UPI003AABB97D